jgi:hypothetical protein
MTMNSNKKNIAAFVLLACILLTACKRNTHESGLQSFSFPAVSALPLIDTLPDLFTMMDGSKVTSTEQWAKRREELKALIQYYEYGVLPYPPAKFQAEILYNDTLQANHTRYQYVRVSFNDHHLPVINLYLYIPLGKGPFPVVLRGDRCWDSMKDKCQAFTDHGYIMAEFDRTDLDKDDANRLDGMHPFFQAYDFGTLAAWAWGYQRVVDFLLTCQFVDKDKISITGHSRGGKTALLAGALDERIALVAPNGSGAGGAGPYRYHITGEDINAITDSSNFFYWFNDRFLAFRGSNVNRLPFDQHSLIALVAPRAYLNTYALGDTWANPGGTIIAHDHARKVYDFLDAGNRMAIHFREGGHDQNDEDWDALLSFADHIFFNKPLPADFNRIPREFVRENNK